MRIRSAGTCASLPKPTNSLLPLPIPTPVFRGEPTAPYPWPSFGGELLPGREAAEAGLSDARRIALARPLASFLRTLHSAAVAERGTLVGPLPGDPLGRADMTSRVPRARSQLVDVARLGLWDAPASVESRFEKAQRLPPPVASAIVHGDLHFRHRLVDRFGALTGVIDWGDICRGDPSIDLQLVWSFLPPEGRTEFLDAYGPVDE